MNYFYIYINRWKEVTFQLDEKLKKVLQRNLRIWSTSEVELER